MDSITGNPAYLCDDDLLEMPRLLARVSCPICTIMMDGISHLAWLSAISGYYFAVGGFAS